ncbi:helicase HerA domain-containing protein [Halostagnicola sp. GCM10023398]|uniref:helicase HerA domain-containing protein n=1 Tax=Halostagnicola sp. GCM10023398 TaxID=3252683 RepID=UPI00360643A4
MSDQQREVLVGETDDGTDLELPVVELLTGRGFVTGKSGSGKSNTASVIAEELLEAGFPLLIVDTDGEYYGLKEEYEMLHAGADEECDIQIGPEHAEQMATLALEENVPVILDVSGYLDEDVADELLREVARQLFVKEKKLKKPFLLVVEEVHEYIPEGGGVGETGNLLIKIGKRGRKHGLGILGISQRPADVKKDFITQANWLVWHRLTWDNDTKVVGRIIDTEYTERVSDLNDGQAFVQTDWTEIDVRKVQFRRKRTFDAGATPGLDDFERPDLKSVSDTLVGDLQEISERKQREESRILELENELEKKEKRIETLEDELDSARDVSTAAKQMADALTRPETTQSQLPGSDDKLRRLHDEIVDLETERDELEATVEKRNERIESLEDELESRTDERDRLRTENRRLRERIDELEDDRRDEIGDEESGTDESAEILQVSGDDHEFGYADTEPSAERTDLVVANEEHDLEGLLETEWLNARLERACDDSLCSIETARRVLAELVRDGPLETERIAARVDRSTIAVQSLVSELRTQSVLERTEGRTYGLDEEVRSKIVSVVESD